MTDKPPKPVSEYWLYESTFDDEGSEIERLYRCCRPTYESAQECLKRLNKDGVRYEGTDHWDGHAWTYDVRGTVE